MVGMALIQYDYLYCLQLKLYITIFSISSVLRLIAFSHVKRGILVTRRLKSEGITRQDAPRVHYMPPMIWPIMALRKTVVF